MSRRAAHPERRGWPRVALTLIGLNLLLTISFSANLPWVRPTATVSPDLLLLVAAAALLGGLSAPRWGMLALLLPPRRPRGSRASSPLNCSDGRSIRRGTCRTWGRWPKCWGRSPRP